MMADLSQSKQFENWLHSYDQADQSPEEILVKFIDGINGFGAKVSRASIWLPTSHPELWGTQVIWNEKQGAKVFRRDHHTSQTPTYINTPGEAVHQSRKAMRWILNQEKDLPYPMLEEIKQQGGTDYIIVPFHTDHQSEQPWITFTTNNPYGFRKTHLDKIIEYCKPLSWKTRVLMSQLATQSLLQVYLGKSAGQKVMQGKFKRGSFEKIKAVIWFCDLRGFTKMADRCEPETLVKILDQYFEIITRPIEKNNGEVLKFIGDAVLAIFPLAQKSEKNICQDALQSAITALKDLEEYSQNKNICNSQNNFGNKDSCEEHLKTGIALHVGEVFYGNVGGSSRLDFTVIGAAVNETSRMESLCKDNYPLLVSSKFQDILQSEQLVSIGEKTLRGVSQTMQMFTLNTLIK